MVTPIVQSSTFVTLLGAGDASISQLERALSLAPILVSADGGAQTALSAGRMPDAVIGDFDSLSGASAELVPPDRLHRIAEQDSTDFDKALRSTETPLALGIGFTGRRIDHALACFNVLLRHPHRKCVLLGSHDALCLVPPRLEIDLLPRERVSLFPMAPVTATSRGLRWPLEGLSFAPDGRSGTSNEASGGAVEIVPEAPAMLLFLPENRFEDLAQALLAAPSWPAPA